MSKQDKVTYVPPAKGNLMPIIVIRGLLKGPPPEPKPVPPKPEPKKGG